VELEFEDRKVRLEAGESVMIPGGMRHNEVRTSDVFELLEVSLPADMGTEACDPP
jgi:mannose-6-phosphate isomerase-like protein (cupin superfamily)